MADESKTADALATVADLSEADRALASLLVELGQAHIFAGWAAGVDTAQRQAFFASLRETDAAYPGGLRAYADNARKFLAVAASGANPLDGYVPEVPEGINLMDATSAQVAEMEDLALPIIKGAWGRQRQRLHTLATVCAVARCGRRPHYSCACLPDPGGVCRLRVCAGGGRLG